VAVIIKYPKSGHIQLFESLLSHGVSKWNWKTFTKDKLYLNYEKIAFRKLYLCGKTPNLASRDQLDKIVFDFVRQTHGLGFRLNYSKLIQSKPEPGESDPAHPIKKDKGFFCSELVALLYKKLGLLSDAKASTQFWPGNFSTQDFSELENEELMVLRGDHNELSEEFEIVFSK